MSTAQIVTSDRDNLLRAARLDYDYGIQSHEEVGGFIRLLEALPHQDRASMLACMEDLEHVQRLAKKVGFSIEPQNLGRVKYQTFPSLAVSLGFPRTLKSMISMGLSLRTCLTVDRSQRTQLKNRT
jgi:hypothetical protein